MAFRRSATFSANCGKNRHLEPQLLRDLCEQLIADQLDIFGGRNHDESTREDDERVRNLLERLQPNISEGARRHSGKRFET
jgi:hypothetical protein